MIKTKHMSNPIEDLVRTDTYIKAWNINQSLLLLEEVQFLKFLCNRNDPSK